MIKIIRFVRKSEKKVLFCKKFEIKMDGVILLVHFLKFYAEIVLFSFDKTFSIYPVRKQDSKSSFVIKERS